MKLKTGCCNLIDYAIGGLAASTLVSGDSRTVEDLFSRFHSFGKVCLGTILVNKQSFQEVCLRQSHDYWNSRLAAAMSST